MQERGYGVDHSTIQRWVVHYAPRIEKSFRKNKKRVGLRWRMNETYIKIRGEWKYLYRAVDKQGNTIDFLLTAKRDKKATRRFLNKAIGSNGKPTLNNIVEQDHRFIKRIIRPMLGFKSFRSAQATLAGIELWRMLKKGQNKSSLSAWEQFYVLALTG